MSVHHHLSDATLMSYSAGNLPQSMTLVIASHLAVCPKCREKLFVLEAIGGAELEQSPVQSLAPNALDRVLGQLGEQEDRPHPATLPERSSSNIPQPLQAYVPKRLSDIAWKSMAPGIKTYALAGMQPRSGTLCLLKIAPGVTIPEHTHDGMELTMVLQGSFSDEIGRFTSGDIADLDDETHHQPIADTDEDCICLVATEAPLRFNKLMPRLVQYFTGM
ncbi:ChrR family anti-sigma-E factor [Magnetovibrio sp. PR-2]|uniref:ChrR family anti-sigma-E factor n=1 Tax=Magnetovibrio sp. PR-2 TaxID=3120356 RepID=UPI002FCE1566